MTIHKKGLFYGIVTMLIFTVNLFPAKILLSKFSPLFVSIITSLVIGFILLPVTFILQKFSLRTIKKEQFPLLISFGVLASTIGGYFALAGLQMTPVSEAAFLLQLEVVFGTITAYFWLKEKISLNQLLGILIMLVGAYLLVNVRGLGFQGGEVFIITATAAFGVTDIMAKKIDPKIPTSILTGLRFLIGGVVLLPFIAGNFPQVPSITVRDVFLLLLNGFFYLTGVTCLYKTIKFLPAAVGSFFLIPAMFLAAVLGIIFLGENLSLVQWIGGILIVAGLVLGIK